MDNDGYENELPLHLKTISIGGLPVEEIPCVEVYDLSGKVSLYVLVMEMWLVWVAGDRWCAVLARIDVAQIRCDRVLDTTVVARIHSASPVLVDISLFHTLFSMQKNLGFQFACKWAASDELVQLGCRIRGRALQGRCECAR